MEEPKRDCYYYDLGGDPRKGYPSYPTEYGARCAKFNKFFIQRGARLEPSCSNCIAYLTEFSLQ